METIANGIECDRFGSEEDRASSAVCTQTVGAMAVLAIDARHRVCACEWEGGVIRTANAYQRVFLFRRFGATPFFGSFQKVARIPVTSDSRINVRLADIVLQGLGGLIFDGRLFDW